MRDVPARKALREWLKQKGNSQTRLAESLGVAQPSVSAWVYGPARPDAHRREALEAVTGISAESWKTGAERQFVARMRASGEAA